MDRLANISIQKIAILRALKLGDFLTITPALRALRAKFPTARIDYIGLPWTTELTSRYKKYVSGFVEFSGWPGLPERPWEPHAVTDFLARMNQHHYDLLLQLHGNGSSINFCAALCGAKITAGYASPHSFWPNTQWFLDYAAHKPEVTKHLNLLEFLGIPAQGEQLEFPILPTDTTGLCALPEFMLLRKNYVCIHPGATSSQPWNAAHFASVADSCATMGLQVVLTGTEPEKEIITNVMQRMEHPAINLASKTTLGTLAALLANSRLFIGNDTGTSHLAVALNIPSVTIFTTSDLARWAPLIAMRHKALRKPTPAIVMRNVKELL